MRGFLGYAEPLLVLVQMDKLVPVLHCNQSSIEGLFSCIRGMGKNRTDLYAFGILQQNLFNTLKHSTKQQDTS